MISKYLLNDMVKFHRFWDGFLKSSCCFPFLSVISSGPECLFLISHTYLFYKEHEVQITLLIAYLIIAVLSMKDGQIDQTQSYNCN